MNLPIISPPAISPPVPAGADVPATVVPAGELTAAPAVPGINDLFSPASIVNLSEEAQLLSTASAVPSAAMTTVVTNPGIISAADPTVAAAIAAYHLGDGLFTSTVNNAEENPPEADIDIDPVPAIDASKLDLHDSARDDAANGIAWNWMRIHPVQRKFTKR